ncbi:hypothetical protein D3C80_1430710 [compost metagenome]
MVSKYTDHGQSIFDLAIQHCGDVSAAWDIAKANGLSVTQALVPGQLVSVPDPVNVPISGYFLARGITIATAPHFSDPSGIGQGRIGIDFQIL